MVAGAQPPPNPFSPTAIATVVEGADLVTVETAATETIKALLSGYLESVRGRSSESVAPGRAPGRVVAVVGDYGAGKTHLLAYLANLAWARRDADPDSVTCVEVDAGTTIRDLYSRLVQALGADELLRRVRSVLTALVVGQLDGAGKLGEDVRVLLDNPDLDPLAVAGGLGFAEVGLLAEMQDRLFQATRHAEVAHVLTLLLRPAFHDRAWNWLLGGAPDPALRERGITGEIDDEDAATRAFGTLTALYGHAGQPLVIAVDEADRLFARLHRDIKPDHIEPADTTRPDPTDPTDPPPVPAARTPRRSAGRASAGRLQSLLETAARSGALLVLAGVDEAFDQLGPIRPRIAETVRVPLFGLAETVRFALRCHERVGRAGLAPFTEEALDTVVGVTDGNPRRVGLYCRRLFARATQDGVEHEITPAEVRATAHEVFGVDKRGQVARAIRRVLNDQDWHHSADYHLSATRETRVDFWLDAAPEAGCGLVLTEAVTDNDDVERLVARAEAIRAAAARERVEVELLLVVGEAIARSAPAALLSQAFGREPLTYHPYTFDEDLFGVVKAMRLRLERRQGGDVLAELREQVRALGSLPEAVRDAQQGAISWMQDQQSRIENVLHRLQTGLDEVRRASIRAGHTAPAGTALPGAVQRLFEDTLGALATFGGAPQVVERVFDDPHTVSEPERFGPLWALTGRGAAALSGLGVAGVLDNLVRQFRQAVDDWFRRRSREPGKRLPAADRHDLEALCVQYDQAFDRIPANALDSVVDVAVALPHDETTPADRDTWADRMLDLRQKAESLGENVRYEVLRAFR
ncbi:AAA family ATPase [Actinokineospora enzanensis]|uniref:AAA family ATPase n=1 Tax=Actinokineospora enzanensis TaxID=155975 RepID=UPI0003A9C60E|nr:AAA family ATPase [Actinokineospora enzanensis]